MKKSRKTVLRIVQDALNRRGLRNELESFDMDIREEMIHSWCSIVEEEFPEESKELVIFDDDCYLDRDFEECADDYDDEDDENDEDDYDDYDKASCLLG